MISQRCALGCLIVVSTAMLCWLFWTVSGILHDLASALQRGLYLLSGF